jgi:lysophospholipase L1-like esterase
MRGRGLAAAALSSLATLACGRHPAEISPTPTPTPPPPPGFTVTAVVFEDDNGNGLQDGGEPAVVPYAELEVGGQVGTSQPGTGGVVITGVSTPGTYVFNIRRLPPFFQPGVPQSVTVPQTGGPVLVPVVLPISANEHGVYLSDGDSITQGVPGSSDGLGYRYLLEQKLRAAFVRAEVRFQSRSGGRTDDGRAHIKRDVKDTLPAFVLIDYGVNDWNPIPGREYDQTCQADPRPPDCPLVENLAAMVDTSRDLDSMPVVATLTPPDTRKSPAQRYQWVLTANELIRSMARSHGALLVDIGDAFVKTGHPNDYLYDAIHPNDAGYGLMADTFFSALTQGRVEASVHAPVLLPLSRAGAADAFRARSTLR